MPIPPPFEARVASGRALSPSVREITFERTDGGAMTFEPGQWCNLVLPTPGPAPGKVAPGTEPVIQPEIKRSYSIASAPDGSGRFSVAVTHVQGGPGSTWLHRVEPNAVITCIGPQGFFTRPAVGGPPSLLVATGTGVTPMRSMLQAAVAARAEANAPMWLLFGARHDHDVLYADEMASLVAEHRWVRFIPTLSQGTAAWTGRRGYVQTHVRELWAELLALGGTPHVYICGLERMVGSVREILRGELGLPRQQVHSERYD